MLEEPQRLPGVLVKTQSQNPQKLTLITMLTDLPPSSLLPIYLAGDHYPGSGSLRANTKLLPLRGQNLEATMVLKREWNSGKQSQKREVVYFLLLHVRSLGCWLCQPCVRQNLNRLLTVPQMPGTEHKEANFLVPRIKLKSEPSQARLGCHCAYTSYLC